MVPALTRSAPSNPGSPALGCRVVLAGRLDAWFTVTGCVSAARSSCLRWRGTGRRSHAVPVNRERPGGMGACNASARLRVSVGNMPVFPLRPARRRARRASAGHDLRRCPVRPWAVPQMREPGRDGTAEPGDLAGEAAAPAAFRPLATPAQATLTRSLVACRPLPAGTRGDRPPKRGQPRGRA
jgi:hypothetical protein